MQALEKQINYSSVFFTSYNNVGWLKYKSNQVGCTGHYEVIAI
jgi:hypothetical protein